MTNEPSPGRRGWAVLLALALPAVIVEFILFFLALLYSERSCSDVLNWSVMVAALAVVPVAYLFIDRRETRGSIPAVIARTVLITIICLMPVAVAAPGLENAPLESKRRETKRRIEEIAKQVEAFAESRGTYPVARNISDLSRAVGKPLPGRDAWCQPLLFESDGKHYSIVSHGKDARPGGGDAYHRYDEDLVFRDGIFEPLKY